MLSKLDYNLRNYSDINNLNESYVTNAYYRSKSNVNDSYNSYNRNEADR